MACVRRYDRKIRITVGIAVILLMAAPAAALRGCMSHLHGSEVAASSHAAGEDQLIELRNGTTMLLDQGALNSKVVDWLRLNTDDKTAFEIGDANFDRGSADPATEGYRAIAQVAQILRADRQLRAQLIVAGDAADDEAAAALERLRAARVKAELRRQGVSSEQIAAVGPQSADLETQIDGQGEHSRLFLVLSR